MYWTCSRVGGGTLRNTTRATFVAFMETSLISNEVFSDLLCLICFICNTWPFIYSVYFSSAFFFCNYCPHEEGFIFLFFWLPLFFSKPHSDSFAESSHDKNPFLFSLSNNSQEFFFLFFNICLAHFLSKHQISHLTLIPEQLPQFSRYRLSHLSVKDWHAMFLLPCQVCVFNGAPRPQREAVLPGHRIRHRKVHADHLHPHCGPRLPAVQPDIFKTEVR